MAQQKTKENKVEQALKAEAEKEAAEKAAPEKKKPGETSSVAVSEKKKTKSSRGRKKGKGTKKAATKRTANKKTTAKTTKASKASVSGRRKSSAGANRSAAYFKTQLETMEKIMSNTPFQFDNLTQNVTESGRENVEALVKSGNVFARGFQDLMKTYVSLAQDNAEKNTQAFKSLLSCKTLTEFTETQSALARQNFDDFLSGFTKLSELSVKVTTEALEPINDQVGKTVKTLSEKAAA